MTHTTASATLIVLLYLLCWLSGGRSRGGGGSTSSASIRRAWELEVRGAALLLSQFSGLLGLGESKRVTTGVTASCGTTAASTARVDVFTTLKVIMSIVPCEGEIVIHTSGRRRRRAHGTHGTHASNGRLITAMSSRLVGSSHGNSKVLAHLLWELEVSMWRNVGHLAVAETRDNALRQHADIDVLLLGGSELVLLLNHFVLLLELKLLSCESLATGN
jgi:hypothetical protein